MSEPEQHEDHWEGYDHDAIDDYCPRCDGEGVVMICPDDLCRAAGECFHGKADRTCFRACPDCTSQPKGEGLIGPA